MNQYFRFIKQIRKRNLHHISNSEINDFWVANNYLAEFSGEKRKKKATKKLNYLRYRSTNIPLVEFQLDIWEPQVRYDLKKVLLCLDLNSRYLFQEIPKSKYFVDMKIVMKKLVEKIRKNQLPIFQKMKTSTMLIHFTTDQGGEFVSLKMQQWLKSKYITFNSVDSPYVLNRCMRTLEKIVAAYERSHENFNLKRDIQAIIDIYNSNFNSAIGKTPKQAMKSFNSISPWGNEEFNYNKNKKEINKKMIKIKKVFPLLSPVRYLAKRDVFQKYATAEKFSKDIFLVKSYKRPLLSSEPVGLNLIDMSGQQLKGIFYEHDLKAVSWSSSPKQEISQIVDQDKEKIDVLINKFPQNFFISGVTGTNKI